MSKRENIKQQIVFRSGLELLFSIKVKKENAPGQPCGFCNFIPRGGDPENTFEVIIEEPRVFPSSWALSLDHKVKAEKLIRSRMGKVRCAKLECQLKASGIDPKKLIPTDPLRV